MITNYNVPRLNEKTPEGDRNKLTLAIKAVAGVEGVTLNTAKHQFEVKGTDKLEPKSADIMAASKKAGFVIEPPKKK